MDRQLPEHDGLTHGQLRKYILPGNGDETLCTTATGGSCMRKRAEIASCTVSGTLSQRLVFVASV